MDPIPFTCTCCGLDLESPPGGAGRRIECPRCLTEITVPGAQQPQGAAAASKPAVEPPEAVVERPVWVPYLLGTVLIVMLLSVFFASNRTSSEEKRAIDSLARLASAAKIGVTKAEYRTMLIDAGVAVDPVSIETRSGHAIHDAFGAYRYALEVWDNERGWLPGKYSRPATNSVSWKLYFSKDWEQQMAASHWAMQEAWEYAADQMAPFRN